MNNQTITWLICLLRRMLWTALVSGAAKPQPIRVRLSRLPDQR